MIRSTIHQNSPKLTKKFSNKLSSIILYNSYCSYIQVKLPTSIQLATSYIISILTMIYAHSDYIYIIIQLYKLLCLPLVKKKGSDGERTADIGLNVAKVPTLKVINMDCRLTWGWTCTVTKCYHTEQVFYTVACTINVNITNIWYVVGYYATPAGYYHSNMLNMAAC